MSGKGVGFEVGNARCWQCWSCGRLEMDCLGLELVDGLEVESLELALGVK